MNKTILLTLFLAGLSACGVKGKPQPPLEPPLLGRGEPVFSEATQDLQIKKKNSIKIDGDWDEPKEFEDSPKEDNAR
jgi:hypothetical protein